MEPSVTDWIAASTGVLTVGAAVVAGLYARRAAHWTKEQAQATAHQVELARAALVVAEQDAKDAHALAAHQMAESDRTARRLAEARVDAVMPTVLARATPGIVGTDPGAFLEIARPSHPGQPYPMWEPVEGPLEVRDTDDQVAFRMNVTVHLRNVSAQIAQVAVVDPAGGEVSVRGGDAVLVLPGEEEEFTWSRTVSSAALRTEEEVNRPEVWLMNVRLWIRDLGMNAYDVVVFNGSLGFFSRDGSRLVVNPSPGYAWTANIGQPLPDRVYDRLNAAAANESSAGAP